MLSTFLRKERKGRDKSLILEGMRGLFASCSKILTVGYYFKS